MEINIMMWLILVISAIIILFFVAISRLSIYRNYFFLLIVLQAFLYLNLSPTILINTVAETSLKMMYVWVQLLCVVFFQIPLLFIYLISKNKVKDYQSDHLPIILVNNNRQLIFSLVMLIISILFIYIVARYDLIFTRIGSEAKALKYLELSSSPLWIIFRLIEKSIFFGVGILLLTYFANNKSSINRFVTTITFIITLLTFGIYYLINSRLLFALFLVFIFGIIVYQSKWQFFKKKWALIVLLIFLPIILSYSMRVTSNIRYNFFFDGGVRLKNFIPWYSAENQIDDNPFNSFIKRMDGIDLMAQVSLNMSYYNIPLGKAWSNPIFMIFGLFINKEKTDKLKLTTDTSAKNYLMENFTDIKLPDYYSCMLTDAYGNFWIIGLVFVAIVLAKLSAYIDKNLLKPRSTISLILSIYLISIILPFEQEFISIFITIIQTLPILLFVIILNPINIKTLYRNGGKQNVFA